VVTEIRGRIILRQVVMSGVLNAYLIRFNVELRVGDLANGRPVL